MSAQTCGLRAGIVEAVVEGLQCNAWKGLLVLALLIGLVGPWALIVGIAEDQSVRGSLGDVGHD